METPWHGGSQGRDELINNGGVSPIEEEATEGRDGTASAPSEQQEEAACERASQQDPSQEDYEPLFRIKSQLTYERGNSHSQFSFEELVNAKKEKERARERRSTANTDGAGRSDSRGEPEQEKEREREREKREGWETPVCLETGIGAQGIAGMRREASAGDLGNVSCRFIGSDDRDDRSNRDDCSNRDDRASRELKSSRLKELQIPEGISESEEQRLTPAVHSADRVQLNSTGFFPIFRSKKDCKVVYLIRHGESEFNAACSARGSSWEDPLLFDARLTCKGKSQALTLRNEVANWDLPSDVVWVTSPLTRAIQTLLHVHPHVEVKDANGLNGATQSLCRTPSGQLENVIVLPEVTEKLHTSGDVGRNPSDLVEEFPMLAGPLGGLEDEWWYNKKERPNCPYKQLFQSHETKESAARRVKEFRKWVIDRPERVFVAVGHSMFWRDFATSVHNGVKQDTMRNCEWRILHV